MVKKKKANKNSVSLILYNTATLRMAGALEKSGEVMKYMQQLVKVPEIQATMQELSKEMMKVCNRLSMYVTVYKYLCLIIKLIYTVMVLIGYLILSGIEFYNFISLLVSTEKIYQTLKAI